VKTLVAVASVALLTFAGVAAQQPPAPGRQGGRGAGAAPPADAAAVTRGLQIYTVNCTTCHGANGRGGSEASTDLSASSIVFSGDGAKALTDFLKVGRPERRMPPFQLADADVADLSAFLRSLSVAPRGGAGGRGAIVAVVVGDAKTGEAFFNGAGGCRACHSAAGDLKGIGTRLPAATIQGRQVLPRGNGGYPPGFTQPPSPSEAPRTVVVTSASGEKTSGKLMWITDFNVTLVDDSGVQRTFARDGEVPKVEVTDPLQWHLDHMRTRTDKEMHDLTAYLVTLK
jgi:cytochrome c oxidase cbb3-type subunit 3